MKVRQIIVSSIPSTCLTIVRITWELIHMPNVKVIVTQTEIVSVPSNVSKELHMKRFLAVLAREGKALITALIQTVNNINIQIHKRRE